MKKHDKGTSAPPAVNEDVAPYWLPEMQKLSVLRQKLMRNQL